MSLYRYNNGKKVAFEFLLADRVNINDKLQSSTIFTNYIQISPNGVNNIKNYDELNSKGNYYTYLSCPGDTGNRFLTGARTKGTNQKVALYVEPGAGRVLFGDEINMFSDKRLKNNIKSINIKECLKTIVNLEPVHFNFKDSNKINFGFIAQDVVKVVPEIINYIDNFVSDYSKLVTCNQNKLTLDVENYCKPGDILKLLFIDKPGSFEVTVDKVDRKDVYLSYVSNGTLTDKSYFLYGKYINDVHTMEEIKLIPFLTGAIKEQQNTITRMKEELDDVKKQLQGIKKLINC